MGNTKWLRMGLVIVLMAVMVSGYGGLCKEEPKPTPVTPVTGTSGDTDPVKIQTTVSEFKSAIQAKNVDAIVSKLTGYDEQTAKNFFNNSSNTTKINALAAALQNATIIKQSENYAVLEANDPQIGKFKIIMVKKDGEWKISGF